MRPFAWCSAILLRSFIRLTPMGFKTGFAEFACLFRTWNLAVQSWAILTAWPRNSYVCRYSSNVLIETLSGELPKRDSLKIGRHGGGGLARQGRRTILRICVKQAHLTLRPDRMALCRLKESITSPASFLSHLAGVGPRKRSWKTLNRCGNVAPSQARKTNHRQQGMRVGLTDRRTSTLVNRYGSVEGTAHQAASALCSGERRFAAPAASSSSVVTPARDRLSHHSAGMLFRLRQNRTREVVMPADEPSAATTA